MIDQSEVASIVGRSDIKVEETAGRALIKLESPTLFQVALPTKAEDELQQIQLLQQEANDIPRMGWRTSEGNSNDARNY